MSFGVSGLNSPFFHQKIHCRTKINPDTLNTPVLNTNSDLVPLTQEIEKKFASKFSVFLLKQQNLIRDKGQCQQLHMYLVPSTAKQLLLN